MPLLQVVAMATSLILFLSLLIFLKLSRAGKAIRAVADNPDLAQVLGVDTDWVHLLVYALGSFLAALAGIIFALDLGATPNMGLTPFLMATIGVIVGGIGSIPGAALAALGIGVIQQLGVWKIAAEWQSAIAFGILLIFIFSKPRGLFGPKLWKAEV